MDRAEIVIRDIHRYGDDLTVPEAIARPRAVSASTGAFWQETEQDRPRPLRLVLQP